MALTPSAQNLYNDISEILRASKKNKTPGEGFISQKLQDALRDMTAADMLALAPPSAETGVWTNDTGFCRRLGARIFGVSPESVNELPWQYFLFFVQIVNANFIRSMEGAIPS